MDTIRNYTFLPWMRRGIGAAISAPDTLGRDGFPPSPERAEISVAFKVNTDPVSRQAQVLGPGDIIGINPRVVVKTEPRNWVTDFESNYLAYAEFYEEDFPWRFTPARAVNELVETRLRPWIVLVVLEEGEFDERKTAGPLAAFEIEQPFDPNVLFPDSTQSWAWAHVHVSRNIIGDSLQTEADTDVRRVEGNLRQTLAANPDTASSRLLSPRKLADNRAYHAFVVPAFETGRLAGLGLEIPEDTDGQRPSWGDGQRLFPIYYRWFFKTGAKGDFEFLVDLLEPRPVDKRVGVRAMDMQAPGYEVDGMSAPLDAMGLEGALKSPETESSPIQWPPENTDFESPPPGSAGAFLNQLEEKVNLQFTLLQEETGENPHPDPIISPPLYGKWHAKADALDVRTGAGWVDELNRDPRFRVPAGVGTQVIQKEQERFMQQAWSQLGDLLLANQKIRYLQLAWMTSFQSYSKNVVPQPVDRLFAFTQPVQSRILGSPTTIARQIAESRLPRAAVDPAFRKLARPRGAIMRRVAPDPEAPARPVITQLNAGTLTAAPVPPEPVGQISLDTVAESIAPDWIPDWLRGALRSGLAAVVLLALLAVSILLLLVTGNVLLFGLLAAGLVGLFIIARRLRRLVDTTDTFREATFTPQFVNEIPARPGFALTEYEAPMPAAASGGNNDSIEAANFRVALKDSFNVYQSPPPDPAIRQPLALDAMATTMKQSLNPAVAIPRRAEFVLRIPATIKDSYLRPRKTVVTVMAHPVFPDAMYRPMRDISTEFLAPNLHLIANNTISLMETNQRFIEAYMVGVNHEMARELLWREFPTDQRGTYFRQFWDVADSVNRDPNRTPAQVEEALLDITKLHTWERDTRLGDHASRSLPDGAEPGDARLVLVIRGDVLKKYPTAVVYAQAGKWSKDEQGRDIRVLDAGNPAQNIKDPIFKAEIEPDLRFLGFDLTTSIVKGSPDPAANTPGWFFVIQERPGEPRFGLDNLSDDSPATASQWNELAWEHLSNFESLGVIDLTAAISADITTPPDDRFAWGRNAADMAYILYQVPVMVAFHAADMLE